MRRGHSPWRSERVLHASGGKAYAARARRRGTWPRRGPTHHASLTSLPNGRCRGREASKRRARGSPPLLQGTHLPRHLRTATPGKPAAVAAGAMRGGWRIRKCGRWTVRPPLRRRRCKGGDPAKGSLPIAQRPEKHKRGVLRRMPGGQAHPREQSLNLRRPCVRPPTAQTAQEDGSHIRWKSVGRNALGENALQTAEFHPTDRRVDRGRQPTRPPQSAW